MIATPQLAREAFFSADVADEQLRAYWQLMEDESYMAFLDMVALDLPRRSAVRPNKHLERPWKTFRQLTGGLQPAENERARHSHSGMAGYAPTRNRTEYLLVKGK